MLATPEGLAQNQKNILQEKVNDAVEHANKRAAEHQAAAKFADWQQKWTQHKKQFRPKSVLAFVGKGTRDLYHRAKRLEADKDLGEQPKRTISTWLGQYLKVQKAQQEFNHLRHLWNRYSNEAKNQKINFYDFKDTPKLIDKIKILLATPEGLAQNQKNILQEKVNDAVEHANKRAAEHQAAAKFADWQQKWTQHKKQFRPKSVLAFVGKGTRDLYHRAKRLEADKDLGEQPKRTISTWLGQYLKVQKAQQEFNHLRHLWNRYSNEAKNQKINFYDFKDTPKLIDKIKILLATPEGLAQNQKNILQEKVNDAVEHANKRAAEHQAAAKFADWQQKWTQHKKQFRPKSVLAFVGKGTRDLYHRAKRLEADKDLGEQPKRTISTWLGQYLKVQKAQQEFNHLRHLWNRYSNEAKNQKINFYDFKDTQS